jgi:hypothetical protein
MRENEKKTEVFISVPDPDPYVFGLPGSVITSRIRNWLQILPFSDERVERTEITVAK